MSITETAVILSACRTPIGSFGGALKDVSAVDLGAVVIGEAVRRAGIAPAAVGDVILGCVLQAGAGMNVARQAALKAGVPVDVPAETVNRVCGSGLQAVIHAANAVRLDQATYVVAGGTESMSQAPYLLKGSRWGYRMGHAEVFDMMVGEGLTCAMEGCHMGSTAETVAVRFGVTRLDQDAFAAESQRRAGAAIEGGLFRDEIVPVDVPQRKGDARRFEVDEYPRPGTTRATLAGLRPAFASGGAATVGAATAGAATGGTVTAGNASGINDGAAALVVSTARAASERGHAPLASIRSFAVTGVEPMRMGIGPVSAIRAALDRAGLTIGQVDLFEINEAFAAQAVAVTRELGLDETKVNTRGGAIALGHPIGASGARILTTLIYALRSRGGGRGVAALCIGGGMGIAMVIEV
jgi:acetyl-CoA C-acetyltransferase